MPECATEAAARAAAAGALAWEGGLRPGALAWAMCSGTSGVLATPGSEPTSPGRRCAVAARRWEWAGVLASAGKPVIF